MKIFVVGLGSGDRNYMTGQALEVLQQADLIVGYRVYIDLLRQQFPDLPYHVSSMREEQARCRFVIQQAMEGKTVALVSSGDSGIYGMAGILLEVMEHMQVSVPVEMIPGVTAASLAASVLGAPLMHDFAVISLSDLLTPWKIIETRVSCAAQADFVICLYNPKSKSRTEQLTRAAKLMMQYQSPDTPVGIVRNAGRPAQKFWFTTLEQLHRQPVDMFCMVIIGNSRSYVKHDRMITPRGYVL